MGAVALTSTDGQNWNSRELIGTPPLHAVLFAGGRFLAVGQNGTLLSGGKDRFSNFSWTPRDSKTSHNLRGIASGSNRYVIVGDQGTISTSPDGLTWTPQETGIPQDLLNIAYGAGTFVAVGAGGVIYVSPDGQSWTPHHSNTTNDLQTVGYGRGTFVAGSNHGRLIQSALSHQCYLPLILKN